MLNLISEKQQADIFARGLLAILGLGTLALIALVLFALWLVVELAALLLNSAVEALSSACVLFSGSPDFVKVVILTGMGYLGYRLVRRFAGRAKI